MAVRPEQSSDAVPSTFDVELYGEYVYAADVNTGVLVLRFDPEVGMMHPEHGHEH